MCITSETCRANSVIKTALNNLHRAGPNKTHSRERFELICKFLHFIDNEILPTYQGPPRFFKIYPAIYHLNINFQTLYLPNQNFTIDEILTPWKGRLSIRQYLPLKASKFGIKTFELCESRKGYLWSFLVYRSKNTALQSNLITPVTPKIATVALELLESLFGRGHTLWLDNFFNSSELARKLKIEHSTDCVGTVKLNRKDVPMEVKDKKLEKGEIIARHLGSVTILKWEDNIKMDLQEVGGGRGDWMELA